MSADPTPHIWKAGECAKSTSALYRDMIRIVQQVNAFEGDEPTLIVRADESLGEKSPLWTWFSSSCEFVPPTFKVGDYVTLGTSDLVGKIINERPHWKTGEPQYRVELPGDKPDKERWVVAVALHHAEAPAPVAYEMKDTDSAAAKPVRDEECPKCGRLLAIAEIGDHEGNGIVYHKCWYCSSKELVEEDPRETDALMRAAQALADEQEKVIAAEERAKVAELRVSKLEAKLREMEVCITQPQPIPASQPVCYEIKTITHRVDLPESDAEYARYLNEGWKENDIATNITSGDVVLRTITFKRMLNTPPQPTRGTAGAHADLTSDFVQRSIERRSPFRNPTPEDEIPVGTLVVESKIKLGPIGTSIKEIGVEATSDSMNQFAVQNAFARAKERIAAMPIFNQPLHILKASN